VHGLQAVCHAFDRDIYQPAAASGRPMNWAKELPAMIDASYKETWSQHEYARAAMSHRFCLAARGDDTGTPKQMELSFGARGGCIPVLVVNPERPSLPYRHLIDWCKVAR
jgi:hypothetical protein